jgi:putative transposase
MASIFHLVRKGFPMRSEVHPYHVTCRCNNKEFFPLPLPVIWKIMLHTLFKTHKEHRLAIHAFVLMGNHFHLLCHTPKGNLDQAVQTFLELTSVEIHRDPEGLNFLWDSKYKWSLIASRTHYFQVYRYIFQNPVRIRLVDSVENYQFSTLKSPISFPLHSFVPMAFGGEKGEINWLNEKYKPADQELIREGLKRGEFISILNHLSLEKG